jgi:hypothetical protein
MNTYIYELNRFHGRDGVEYASLTLLSQTIHPHLSESELRRLIRKAKPRKIVVFARDASFTAYSVKDVEKAIQEERSV